MAKDSHPQPGQLALFEEITTQAPVAGEPAQHAVASEEAGLAIQEDPAAGAPTARPCRRSTAYSSACW